MSLPPIEVLSDGDDDDDSVNAEQILSLEESERRATAKSVYADVWNKFYEWANEDSILIIRSLRAPSNQHAQQRQSKPPRKVHEQRVAWRKPVVRIPSPEGYSEDSPPYEACTPIPRNVIMQRTSSTPFVPYGDEPSFPHDKYLEPFDNFDWDPPGRLEAMMRDPDLEIIQVEAMYRLHREYGMTLAQIDKTRVLPPTHRPEYFRTGLLWRSTQRDPLIWPGMSSRHLEADHEQTLSQSEAIVRPLALPPHITSHAPHVHDYQSRFELMHDIFCPSLSCIQPVCELHELDKVGLIRRPQPTKTSKDMLLENCHPCGSSCFRSVDLEDLRHHVSWEDDARKELEFLFSLMPDASPCGIAVTADRPCWEIFVFRKDFFRAISNKHLQNRSLVKLRAPDLNNHNIHEAHVGLEPCRHKGPCNIDCLCFTDEVWCQRSCSCELDCKLRLPGCDCDPRQIRCCEHDECLCKRAMRECDPELCKCRATKGKVQDKRRQPDPRVRYDIEEPTLIPCKNVNIQLAKYVEVEVKTSDWGFGAFAEKKIPRHTFLTEYVGQFMDDFAASAKDYIHKHTQRNYAYGLNDTPHNTKTKSDPYSPVTLDAQYAGNFARFLNHSSTPNCETRYTNVHGDLHMALYTIRSVDPGSELCLSYGASYWGDTWSTAKVSSTSAESQLMEEDEIMPE